MLHKKRKPSTFTSSDDTADCNCSIVGNSMLHSKSTYFYRWVPISCSAVFLLGLGIIFNPTASTTNLAHAETVTASPTDYSSISLTISNNGTELNTGDTVSTNVEPGLVSYITNNLRIDTKKINRFYVSIQAAEDGTSELTGTNNHATIAPVGSNKIPTATDDNGFGDNTWGFALGEANADNASMSYNSLPAYGTSTTPQYSSDSNLADGTYNLKLTFAAKINADKPSDHYTTKAMVSVAADAKYISGFINLDTDQPITTMQEMTPNICKYAPDGHSTQLKDSRDDKLYWVSKVNNQCIMTQNLDFDIPEGTLSAAETDIDADWTTAKATKTGTSWTWTDSNNGQIESYDPGLYYINQATSSQTACDATKNPATCNRYTKITDANMADETLHYAVGNYYNWYTATAETGDTNADDNAPGSICPKGWKLFDNDGPKSFKAILGTATNDTVRKSPYYFPATGYTYNGGISGAGLYGLYWSSVRVANSDEAYLLDFGSIGIYPQYSFIRSRGYSVRCLVK